MLIIAALLAAGATQPAYQPAKNGRPVPACAATQITPVVDRGVAQGRKVTRLGELPTAAIELTVDRRVDGCPVPVVVSNDAEQNVRSGGR